MIKSNTWNVENIKAAERRTARVIWTNVYIARLLYTVSMWIKSSRKKEQRSLFPLRH